MYPLGTWFVSGICVWIPCIKETMMMMMMIIIIIIIFHKSEISALGGCWGLNSNYCPGWRGLKFIVMFKCIPNL